MQIHLISVGHKMPDWVKQGYDQYAKRLPREWALICHQIAPGKRLKNTDVARLIQAEGERMLAALPKSAHAVTLDLQGQLWSTAELAKAMQRWQASGRKLALMVGGPEGLANSVKQRANESWALSKLTLPHPLVRVIVAEQLYRAWSILANHPYHR